MSCSADPLSVCGGGTVCGFCGGKRLWVCGGERLWVLWGVV